MGEVLRRLGKLLRLCWKPLLLFELLYKLAAVAVLFAFGGLAFRAATEWGDFNYLTLENLPRFLRHPLVIAALLLFLLLSALLALPDVGASVYAFWRAEEGFRPRFHHFLSVVAGGLRRVFRVRGGRLLLQLGTVRRVRRSPVRDRRPALTAHIIVQYSANAVNCPLTFAAGNSPAALLRPRDPGAVFFLPGQRFLFVICRVP